MKINLFERRTKIASIAPAEKPTRRERFDMSWMEPEDPDSVQWVSPLAYCPKPRT